MSDQPQTAAPEAATSNEDLLWKLTVAVLDWERSTSGDELQHHGSEWTRLRRELLSRLAAAAPPSGQVCVDREHVSAMRNELIRVDAQGGDLRVPVRQCVTWLLDLLSADEGADR